MVSAIGERNVTYKDLVEKSVCDISYDDCMLYHCKKCPGETAVKKYRSTNALQSFHWNNRQLTIHLFDAYYKVEEEKLNINLFVT